MPPPGSGHDPASRPAQDRTAPPTAVQPGRDDARAPRGVTIRPPGTEAGRGPPGRGGAAAPGSGSDATGGGRYGEAPEAEVTRPASGRRDGVRPTEADRPGSDTTGVRKAGATRAASVRGMGVSRQSHRPSGSGRSLKGAPSSRRFAMSLRSTLDRPSRPGETKDCREAPKRTSRSKARRTGRSEMPGPVGREGVRPRDGAHGRPPGGDGRARSLRAPHLSASPGRLGLGISRPRPQAFRTHRVRRPSAAGHRPPTAPRPLPHRVRRPSGAGHRPPTAHGRFSRGRLQAVRGEKAWERGHVAVDAGQRRWAAEKVDSLP
ncbi:hypothetical protein ACVWXB_006382 [Streptomyces sp. TE12347]